MGLFWSFLNTVHERDAATVVVQSRKQKLTKARWITRSLIAHSLIY